MSNPLLHAFSRCRQSISSRWGLAFSSIVAGGVSTCAVDPAGDVYCWGDNKSGQLGRSPDELDQSAVPLKIPTHLKFVSLTAGGTHVCGLATDSLAYCWGSNNAGQLGIASENSSDIPRRVVGQQ